MKWLVGITLALSLNAASAAPQVQPLMRGSYQKIISAHAGKPFVVALWSLSCTHCGADLEIFGRLAKKYAEFNLVLISTDSPELDGAISRTLKKYQLGQADSKYSGKVESWVFADSYTERLHFEIDRLWYGELPRTYFYDATGKAAATSGVLDAEKTEQWIRANQ